MIHTITIPPDAQMVPLMRTYADAIAARRRQTALGLALGALALALAQTAKADSDTEVQLRADAAVPYGRIVEVMGLAQQAGLNRIGFVADSERSAAAAGPAGRKP